MAITGAWRNSPAATQGENARTFVPRDNWGEGVDPRHDTRTPHDVWSDLPWQDPTGPKFQQEVPEEIEDQYNVSYMPPQLPSPLDGEPKGHDGLATAPWAVGPWRSQETNNLARSQDRGMPRFFQTREMIGRGVTQKYDRERTQSLPPSRNNGGEIQGGQAGRAMRGDNALALNNPGNPEVNGSGNYIRQGWEQNAFVTRWMPRRTLTHTRRFLHLNLAQTAMPSAAPTGDAYSPYTSPFDGRTTNMATNRLRGMTRREPRQYDEDTITDGLDQGDDTWQFNKWGL